MLSIRNAILQDVEYIASPNISGKIDPKFLVMHYTATWGAESAIWTLTRRGSGVSAHVVLDVEGTITQLVPFDRRAWHAGPSEYMGYSGLNGHSIGIEIVNPGFLRKIGNSSYQDDHGTKVFPTRHPLSNHELVAEKYARVGSGMFYWPTYTQPQFNALDALTRTLINEYDLIDVVGHEEIDTRGWKTDPGPAFPMNRYRKMIPSRDKDTDTFSVTASSLNVRSGPGTEFGKIASFKEGDRVELISKHGVWARVSADGWVHSAYLRRV